MANRKEKDRAEKITPAKFDKPLGMLRTQAHIDRMRAARDYLETRGISPGEIAQQAGIDLKTARESYYRIFRDAGRKESVSTAMDDSVRRAMLHFAPELAPGLPPCVAVIEEPEDWAWFEAGQALRRAKSIRYPALLAEAQKEAARLAPAPEPTAEILAAVPLQAGRGGERTTQDTPSPPSTRRSRDDGGDGRVAQPRSPTRRR